MFKLLKITNFSVEFEKLPYYSLSRYTVQWPLKFVNICIVDRIIDLVYKSLAGVTVRLTVEIKDHLYKLPNRTVPESLGSNQGTLVL